jgi:hypothetical protein
MCAAADGQIRFLLNGMQQAMIDDSIALPIQVGPSFAVQVIVL